jgi:uncharacterized protein YecT (DUF1311 family)
MLAAPATEGAEIPPETAAVTQALEECLAGGIDPFSDDRCYKRHAERQETRLERALADTRRYLARRHRETSRPGALAMADARRDPAYLDRSQRAWRDFVEHNCTVRAGLLWGSNVSVSRGERSCYLEELERRIAFLESIASGEFIAP